MKRMFALLLSLALSFGAALAEGYEDIYPYGYTYESAFAYNAAFSFNMADWWWENSEISHEQFLSSQDADFGARFANHVADWQSPGGFQVPYGALLANELSYADSAESALYALALQSGEDYSLYDVKLDLRQSELYGWGNSAYDWMACEEYYRLRVAFSYGYWEDMVVHMYSVMDGGDTVEVAICGNAPRPVAGAAADAYADEAADPGADDIYSDEYREGVYEQSGDPGYYYGRMYVVNCDRWISLRENPDANSRRLAEIPLGAELEVYAYDGAWGSCWYGGEYGFVRMEYLSDTPPAVAEKKLDENYIFTDAALEAAIRKQLGKPAGSIYASELLGITELFLDDCNDVRDISALRDMKNLKVLLLTNTQVSDIEPLRGLTNLTDLCMNNNQIRDIEPLRGLTNLEYLHMNHNQVSDIEPLRGLTNLIELRLEDNQIRDIEPLSGMTNLIELNLSNNQIRDIGPLRGLTNLECLNLSDNQISDIGPVRGLMNLFSLNVGHNQISNIEPLRGMTGLYYLYLNENRISDIEPVRSLTNLSTLSFFDNQISDIEPLRGLTSLFFVIVGGNPIRDRGPLEGLRADVYEFDYEGEFVYRPEIG